MKLKSLFLATVLPVVLLAGSGCHLFGKSKKPKDNPAIAAGVEADFRQRWIDRRTTELVGKGTESTAARTQAEQEFREAYPYLKEGKK